MKTTLVITFLASLAAVSHAHAKVQSKTVAYKHGEAELQGYLVWDDSIEGRRPGILVVHEWWGLNEYVRSRADQLAKLGYVAFALDMYGEGKVTKHPKQASEWAGQIRANVGRWRERALAGLDVLRKQEQVDPDRIAAIGYCFGGATVMQMAYGGADLKGVVSFHGSLPAPEPQQQKERRIKASLLICHGAADPFVPEDRAQKLREALAAAAVDWHMIYYGGARHSFTNPAADQYGIDGIKYDKRADERSWRHMQIFFGDLFGRRK